MGRNYFKTAWLSLIKSKAHSFINIPGLSAAILIVLCFWGALSFDKSFDNYSRVAQVMQKLAFNGGISTGKAT